MRKVGATAVGQLVTPAQTLVRIVPDGIPLIVEASVTNQDLRAGQPVDVKVDTLPFQKCGSLNGTLVWISPDAEYKNTASKIGYDGAGGYRDRSPEGDRVLPLAGAQVFERLKVREPGSFLHLWFLGSDHAD